MNGKLTCTPCPCHNEDICIKAGYNNGQEFGDALRHQIAESKRAMQDASKKNKEASNCFGKGGDNE